MNPKNEHDLEPSGEFAASIRDFRSAVTHVAKRETARPLTANWLTSARKRHKRAQQRIALGWACAALLCFAALPFSSYSRHAAPTHPIAEVTAPATESDTALLEQVDTDVSESIPSSLAPLADLDNWGDSSAGRTSPRQTENTHAQ